MIAGLHVIVARQIRVGDYVRLQSGEGHVSDIGWRATTLRMLPNNLVIIRNTSVSQAIVTNYNLPE